LSMLGCFEEGLQVRKGLGGALPEHSAFCARNGLLSAAVCETVGAGEVEMEKST
jgi:hypothetical protein